jgi:choline dehydrogenase-like flavoprotein
MIHDEPGGRIHHAFGRRFITYRLSSADSRAVSRTLSLLGETFLAAGARELYLPILGLEPRDADQFRAMDFDRVPRRKLECSSQHPLGTARMGVSAEHSVVGPDGECWELENLFVADGSVMPTSLGVNPQETIMAMATRIAFRLRERALPPCAKVSAPWL